MVLIDTWWNVNNIHAYIVNRLSVVLIDTWWNVNKTKIEYLQRKLMF